MMNNDLLSKVIVNPMERLPRLNMMRSKSNAT